MFLNPLAVALRLPVPRDALGRNHRTGRGATFIRPGDTDTLKGGSQPKIADRFIRAIYRELNEGNAHIRDMIERLVDSDLDKAQIDAISPFSTLPLTGRNCSLAFSFGSLNCRGALPSSLI